MTKRKRALFLINSLTGGGAERVMCTLLRHSEVEREEFDITLAVLDNEPAGNTPPDWVDVRQFDCRFSLPRSIMTVRQLHAELRPDVSLSFLNRANWANALGSRAPFVISQRAHASHHLANGLRGAVSRTMVRTLFPRASRIIAVSDGVARDLSESFDVPVEKIVSIPNPVDVEAIQAKSREVLPVAIDGSFIMSAGRLVKVKNFAMLIRAFAAAGGEGKLVIAGEGEERGVLEALARELGVGDRVILPGYIANPYPLMAAAEMFILSSDSEGYPNALIEGMAAGRPVISTNCDSGPSQILADAPRHAIQGITYAEHGVLVPVDNADAMAEAIRALRDPAKREAYGRKAVARAGAFSAAAIKNRYWDVMREAMNARRGSMPSDALQAEAKTLAASNARPLRIGIFGGYGTGNFGNDASFEALYNFLRAEHPNAEISAICSKPENVTKRFGVKAFGIAAPRPEGIWRKLDTLMLRQPSTWRNWARCLKALNEYDVILSGGTGVFDDFRDTPLGWPSVLGRWCLAAKLKGVTWRFVSVGAGPITNPLSREMFKHTGRLAKQRLYRDQDSYDFMKRLGVDGPLDGVVPDLAFLLPAPDVEKPVGTPLVIGVGMMTYHGWSSAGGMYEKYIALHVELIQWLLAEGHDVRMIIGQTPTDLTAARDVEARIGRKFLTPRDEQMSSIHDAMAAIAETDMVIASRYHVQIAALKAGKPLVSLSYGPKNDALMADVGLSDFAQDVDHADFEKLRQQINTMIADREHYATQVREKVATMKARLIAALKALDLSV